MPEERILAPFPDTLVTAGVKEDAIRFLLDLGVPSRIASSHLTRWGEVAGVEITKADIRRVRSDLARSR